MIKMSFFLTALSTLFTLNLHASEALEKLDQRGLFCMTEYDVDYTNPIDALNKVYINPKTDGVRTISIDEELSSLRNMNCEEFANGYKDIKGKGLVCSGIALDQNDLSTKIGDVEIVIDYSNNYRMGGEDILSAVIYSRVKSSGLSSWFSEYSHDKEDAYCEVYSVKNSRNIINARQ